MTRDLPDEANRYDGAPAPKKEQDVSVEAAKAEAAEAMRNATCDHCDADEDYHDMVTRPSGYDHNCPASQHPNPRPVLLCEQCDASHNPEEEYVARFRDRDDVYVRYGCGIVRSTDEPDLDTVDVDGERQTLPGQNTSPVAPTHCECGEPITGVLDS